MKDVTNLFRLFKNGSAGKSITACLVATLLALSPVWPSAAVIAAENEDAQNDTAIVATAEGDFEVTVDSAETEAETEPELSEETVVEEPETDVVPAESEDTTDSQAPPVETDVVSETEVSGELETSETDVEATEPANETESVVETPETTEAEEPGVQVDEYIVFDQYFTVIDESLVQTPDLMVQTGDASVFTYNTNVISNYDDVYILSFSSVEEARYAYSYYVDKVDAICDLSSVVSIATGDDTANLSDLNNGSDAISNLNDITVADYSGYIALIDTGASADANYSVIGSDTADYNGHGSEMYGYILEENPDAKVVSIKVTDGKSANAADIYAGFKLAITMNVSVINFSMTGYDIEKNQIIKDVINEAIASGIVVIGAAGNSNADANKYIAGCIEGATVVGAVNSDGTKTLFSNYNADLYVVADSTSEAAARYTGIYTAGVDSDKVFAQFKTESDEETTPVINPDDWEVVNTYALDNCWIEEYINGYVRIYFDTYSVLNDTEGNGYVEYYETDEFETDSLSYSTFTTDSGVFLEPNQSGTSTGSCEFVKTDPGYGYIRNFYDESGTYVLSQFTDSLDCECEGHDDNSTQSSYAYALSSGWYDYQMTWSTGDVGADGKVHITFEVLISDDGDFGARSWSNTDLECEYWLSQIKVTSGSHSGQYYITARVQIGSGTSTLVYDSRDDSSVGNGGYYSLNVTGSEAQYAMKARNQAIQKAQVAIEAHTPDTPSQYQGKRFTDASDWHNMPSLSGLSSSSADVEHDTAWFRYQVCSQNQVYTRFGDVTGVYNVQVTVKKTAVNASCVADNPMYSLAGTTYGLYKANGTLVHTFTINANGNTTAYTLDSIEDGMYVKEITAGPGFKLNTATYPVKLSNVVNGLITISATDEPLIDPIYFDFIKTDNANWNMVNELKMSNTTFEFYYYANVDTYTSFDAYSSTHTPTATGTLTLNDFQNYCGVYRITPSTLNASGIMYFAPFVNAGNQFPIGTYVLKEKNAPTGYLLEISEFAWVIKQTGNDIIVTPITSSNAIFSYTAIENGTVYMQEQPVFGYASFKKVVDSNNDLEKLAPDLYNLDGTQYGVYSSADNLIMTITFDGNGNVKNVVYSSTLNLPAADKWTSGNNVKMQVGSYYIKELHSTNGYYLDPEKHTFTVTNGSTTAVTVQDTPIVAPFDMVLKTATSDSLSQEVLDLLSTQGATFIVTYYNTIITDGNINSAVPVLEATFITDATGTFTYDSGWYTPEFAASMYSTYADKLMDKDGNYMAPQGTYVIREITAPQDLEKSDVVLIIPVEFGKDIVKDSANDPAFMTAWSASLHNTVLDGVVYDAATGKFLYPNAINPTFNTNAANTNGGKQLIADVDQSITDTVTITKLASGFSYEVAAWLVSDNGTPADTTDDTYVSFAGAKDVNGVPTVTKSVTLNVTGVNNSTFDIVFNGIDATNYEGCTITVCENLYLIESNGTKHLYLAHDDINDILQQVSVPGIRTTMLDAKIDTYDANADVWGQYTDSTGYTKHVAYGTDETLVDYVSYINLIPGEEYTVSGVLKNADTGEDLPYTGSTTFVPTTKTGVVEVYFEHVDTTKFVTAVVAFEYLDHDGIRIATHEDLSDSWQSLGPNPKIATEYLDVQSDSHGAVIGENVPLTDTVEITGLVVGQIYTLETTVYNGNNKVFIGTTTFEAGVDTDDIKWGTPYQIIDGITVVDGTLTVKTEVDTSKLIDIAVDPVTGVITDTKTSIVATQKLYFKGELISEHTDKNDQDQTVDVESPDIQTLFTDVQTVEHDTVTGQEVELADIVSYKGLHIGETYTMTCVIYDQTTGDALKYSDGTPVTMVKEFVPQTADGSVNVEITVNTADLLVNTFALEEKTLVAFEYLRTADGTLIAGHTDLEDQPQWVTPKKPELSTMLVDSASLTHDGAIGVNVVLTDTINYTNLNVGETYEVRGALMLVDETGTASVLQVAAPVEFVPTSREGFVEVTFVVDSAALIEGDKSVYVVAFEELWQKNILTDEYEKLASHEDIDDQDQTVNFDTDLKTTATDAETGTKVMVLKETVSITDKVEFTNLNIGEEYTITGTLMNKATGEALLDENNQPYVQSLTFTATERDGYKEIVFKDVKVPYTVMSVVVFEDLYVGDMTTPVAIHHDLTDENQTVERPTASTIATVDGQKQVWLGNAEVVQLTITDTISYTNLVPGKTYRIETALYKADGTVVMNGENVATATALFIPETKDGTVDITIAFTTEGLVEGDKIVVFEQIWDVAEDIEKTEKTQTEDLLIAKHEDLNDSDQTIMIHFRPQTGLIDTPYAKIGIALIVSAAVGYFVYRTFKKKNWFTSET